MSKRFYIPAIIFIFLAALVILTPRLLDIDSVRSKVASIVSAKSGWQIDASQLNWYWLPTPHFSVKDIVLTRNDAFLTLPEARIFPLWQSLLLNKIELREVELINPELQIDSFTDYSDGELKPLPAAKITIKNGSVLFNNCFLPGQEHLFPLNIQKIDAAIYLTTTIAKFQLSSRSEYYNFLELDGSLTYGNLAFALNYEINGLQFDKLLPVFGDKRLLPVNSAISLQGNITGNSTKRLTASMQGDFPCFVAPAATDSFLLDCGNADLDFTKDEDGLTVTIKEMQLKNPGLFLSGKIARLTGENSVAYGEPLWLIDLAGKDLDLSAVRKGVLTLWPNHPVAKTVSEIVLSGKAKRATYFFKAPLAGFEDIKNMKINVDVEEASIHPPHTPLFLEKARGQIEINRGYLSGSGLAAKLGSSIGSNCAIFLDLDARGNDFKLDLDIDADLVALPEILHELVPNQKFRKGNSLFSNIKGRAAGHLTIGPTLDDPKVHVNIKSVNGGANYGPIPHPFRIRSGRMDISPDKVKWSGIRGVVGPHLIREVSGEISWHKNVAIKIESAQASFDSAVLLNDLRNGSILPATISKAIAAAEGITKINKATLSGYVGNPDKWRYSVDLSTSGSRWLSPLLPQPILAERVKAQISQDKIEIISGKIWFLEQPLLIEGSFFHKNYQDWQARSIFSGTIRKPLADWIREKGWVPSEYFPVIPCTLDKLKVLWDSDRLEVSGGIAAGTGEITSPSLRLQIESAKDRLQIHELTISSPEEQGRLTLEYLKNETNTLHASWQGFINAKTVHKLLNNKILPAERIEGDFAIKYDGGKGDINFTGWAKARQMTWLFNDNRPGFMIKDLNINGEQDGSLKINHAVIANNDEELNLNGRLNINREEINFDLGLEAEKIAKDTVTQIIADIRAFPATSNSSKSRPASLSGKTVKGAIHFKASQFSSNQEVNQTEDASLSSFSLQPANGFITIDSSAKIYSLDLGNSKICELDISGTINSKESNHESSLTIFTDSSSPSLFENVLPCFGFKDAIIDGKIFLDVNMKGEADKWLSGNANLYSDGGYIHRLGFLSKVFRVINLRDIFSGVGMPDFTNKGFAFTRLDITSHIEGNKLHIDKAFIDGEGLNVFGQGTIDLGDWSADLKIMVAPLKSVDAIVTKIPIIGKVVGGKDNALISIPVSLKGDLRDPEVTVMSPEAIGEGLLNLIANTLMIPIQIISPLLPAHKQQ